MTSILVYRVLQKLDHALRYSLPGVLALCPGLFRLVVVCPPVVRLRLLVVEVPGPWRRVLVRWEIRHHRSIHRRVNGRLGRVMPELSLLVGVSRAGFVVNMPSDL